jgi:hypothetical protein
MFNGEDFDYNQHAQDLDRPDLCCVPHREKGAFTPPEDTNSACSRRNRLLTRNNISWKIRETHPRREKPKQKKQFAFLGIPTTHLHFMTRSCIVGN